MSETKSRPWRKVVIVALIAAVIALSVTVVYLLSRGPDLPVPDSMPPDPEPKPITPLGEAELPSAVWGPVGSATAVTPPNSTPTDQLLWKMGTAEFAVPDNIGERQLPLADGSRLQFYLRSNSEVLSENFRPGEVILGLALVSPHSGRQFVRMEDLDRNPLKLVLERGSGEIAVRPFPMGKQAVLRHDFQLDQLLGVNPEPLGTLLRSEYAVTREAALSKLGVAASGSYMGWSASADYLSINRERRDKMSLVFLIRRELFRIRTDATSPWLQDTQNNLRVLQAHPGEYPLLVRSVTYGSALALSLEVSYRELERLRKAEGEVKGPVAKLEIDSLRTWLSSMATMRLQVETVGVSFQVPTEEIQTADQALSLIDRYVTAPMTPSAARPLAAELESIDGITRGVTALGWEQLPQDVTGLTDFSVRLRFTVGHTGDDAGTSPNKWYVWSAADREGLRDDHSLILNQVVDHGEMYEVRLRDPLRARALSGEPIRVRLAEWDRHYLKPNGWGWDESATLNPPIPDSLDCLDGFYKSLQADGVFEDFMKMVAELERLTNLRTPDAENKRQAAREALTKFIERNRTRLAQISQQSREHHAAIPKCTLEAPPVEVRGETKLSLKFVPAHTLQDQHRQWHNAFCKMLKKADDLLIETAEEPGERGLFRVCGCDKN